MNTMAGSCKREKQPGKSIWGRTSIYSLDKILYSDVAHGVMIKTRTVIRSITCMKFKIKIEIFICQWFK